jgi:hypothetical protein
MQLNQKNQDWAPRALKNPALKNRAGRMAAGKNPALKNPALKNPALKNPAWIRSRRGRAVLGAAAVPLAITFLAGCTGHGALTVNGTAGPADVGSSTSASASSPASASPTSASGGGAASTKPATSTSHKGCPAGGAAIPSGAGTAHTVDLDGDGKGDTIWLKDISGRRTLGVRTASGAGFTRTFQSAAPQAAGALANRLSDGSAVILLDTGRAVPLYAVVGCKIIESVNAQGQQYSFDLGFTGYGTGVGCPLVGGNRRLTGYNTVVGTGGKNKVTRTTIIMSGGGAKARNGSAVILGTSFTDDSGTVKIARSVTCGSAKMAGEPVS